MDVERYLKLRIDKWIYDSFNGVIIIPETAVYKKGVKFAKYEFDYYKTNSKKYIDFINELTAEANKLNLSQIQNILHNSKHLVSKKDIIDKAYLDPNNWSGATKDSEKRNEIVTRVNEDIKNLKKISDISHLTISKMDNELNIMKRDYYTLFTFNGEVYLLNAIRTRNNELKAEIRNKKGKEKRLQKIKERKSEQRK